MGVSLHFWATSLVFGVEMGGAQRWIGLGPFNLQPSEFARLAIPLVLATFYAQSRRETRTMGDWVLGAAFVVVPFTLIAREPDLGTAVTLLPVCLAIMLFAGLPLRFLASIVIVASWCCQWPDLRNGGLPAKSYR